MKEAIDTRVGQTIHVHTYGDTVRSSVFHISLYAKVHVCWAKEMHTGV